MTDYSPALDTLLLRLREALVVLQPNNPNRASVSQALCYTEESWKAHRGELLRLAAAHLKNADADTGLPQGEASGAARRAMTVALFEYTAVEAELPPARARVSPPSLQLPA